MVRQKNLSIAWLPMSMLHFGDDVLERDKVQSLTALGSAANGVSTWTNAVAAGVRLRLGAE